MNTQRERADYIVSLYQKINPHLDVNSNTEIKNTTIWKLCETTGGPFQRIKTWCEDKTGQDTNEVEETKSALDTQIGGDHYKTMKIDVATFCHENKIPFNEGNVLKYICRWRNKNGIEDLNKAKHYINMIIELENNK